MVIYRKTWAEINLDAIYNNVSQFKKRLAQNREIMAVVKADGYGHGAIPVAKTALKAGASWLATALLEEAIELRKAGLEVPILVMGYVPAQHIPLAQRYQIRITVPDYAYFTELVHGLSSSQPPLLFHVKLDTGMGRLGMYDYDELARVVDEFHRFKGGSNQLVWEGLFSHLATADGEEEEQERILASQVQAFDQMVSFLREQGIKPALIHLANSAALIRQTFGRYSNAVRLGISLYGLLPSAWMNQKLPFQLQPALSLYSHLSQVKRLPPESGISYGCTYRTKGYEWIGTVPIGYADGYSRLLSNKGIVLIGGKPCPVVGRVCMDQLMVKLDRPYPRGARVTLIGRQGNQQISADHLARWIGTINYEITCQISKRVPRLYIGSNPEVRDLVSDPSPVS